MNPWFVRAINQNADAGSVSFISFSGIMREKSRSAEFPADSVIRRLYRLMCYRFELAADCSEFK